MHVCALHVCLVPKQGRRGHLNLTSQMWLWNLGRELDCPVLLTTKPPLQPQLLCIF